MTTRERHLALSLLCIAAAGFRAWPPTTRSRQSGTPGGPSCRGRHRVPGRPRRGSFNFDNGERIARRSLTGKTDHRLHKVWFDCAELHWTRMLKTSRRVVLRGVLRADLHYAPFVGLFALSCFMDGIFQLPHPFAETMLQLTATNCCPSDVPSAPLPASPRCFNSLVFPLNATQKPPPHTRAQIDHLNDSTPLTGSRSPRSSLRFSTVKWTVRAATTQRMKICAPMVAPRPGK